MNLKKEHKQVILQWKRFLHQLTIQHIHGMLDNNQMGIAYCNEQ